MQSLKPLAFLLQEQLIYEEDVHLRIDDGGVLFIIDISTRRPMTSRVGCASSQDCPEIYLYVRRVCVLNVYYTICGIL